MNSEEAEFVYEFYIRFLEETKDIIHEDDRNIISSTIPILRNLSLHELFV